MGAGITGPSTRRWPGPALVLLAALCCGPPEVSAQWSLSLTSERAAIEESAPINNLIKRSRQGIERRDWKLVIDSLQRIIEDSQGVRLESSPGLYESSRRYAVRSLAALPPEGLAAYRLLNDGRAKTGLGRAIAGHDTEGLRRIVDHYLLTSYGDDAPYEARPARIDVPALISQASRAADSPGGCARGPREAML